MDILQNKWAKYGLYYALVSIVIQLISYYVFPIGVWMQMLIGIAIMIGFFYIVTKEEKEENSGVLPYGKAFKASFLTGLVGLVITTLFTIILIQLVDPGLVEKLAQVGVDAAKSMMESFGMPEDQMAAALEKAEEDTLNSFTPGKQLLGILWGSIFIAIIAAIFSIFVKKEADPNQLTMEDIGSTEA